MTDPLCSICNSHHHPRQAHRFAINRPKVAINAGLGGLAPTPAVVQDALILGKTPNRRDRKDYNAYMREYMRKRRSA